MLGISDDDAAGARTGPRKRKKQIITFNEDEEVINPEDIDPTVGRFRNLIHSTVIPTKVRIFFFLPAPTFLVYAFIQLKVD